MTHPNLKSLSERELWVELKSSKEYLENYLDKTINVISYPFGKFNERVIELTQKADYLGGCTLGYNFPHTQSFPYELFRRGVYFLEPFFLFKAKLRNGKLSHMDDLKQRFITSCSQGTLLYNYLKSILKTT